MSIVLPSALYMLEHVNACTIPEKLVKHSTCIHGIFSGGVASQGKVHSRGSGLHECLETHLMSPIVNKGEKLYDSSSINFFLVTRGS